MSAENVEIVRKLVAAVQRGDSAAVMAAYDARIELDQSRALDGGVFHGHDGVRRYFRKWFGAWDDLRIVVERLIDLDEERVLVLLEVTGTGRGSGVRVSMKTADVFTLRDGKIVQFTGYPDRAAAFQALGLAEQS